VIFTDILSFLWYSSKLKKGELEFIMTKYAAFFDLDHTIVNVSSGRIMFEGSRLHKLIGRKESIEAIIMILLNRLGLLSEESAIERSLMWYRGISDEAYKPVAVYCAQMLKNEIRNDARREIKFHQDKCAHTVILSASTPYICNQIKMELEMDDVICTELEYIDNRFTGKIKGRYCYGTEKLVRMRQYCQEKGLSAENAFYYADSINDLPVLEAVAVPVCVTPDKKLERIALKRGWKISLWE
jgi:HAD superfamily hydrolase (TIGR01490 family)